jgi:hypothetical protein
MAIHLTLAHGSNAHRDRARLVALSNAGTEWQGANRSISGRRGLDGFGKLNPDTETRAQLRSAEFVIYSYETPIAWRTGAAWTISPERYSPVTGRHQSYLHALTR